MTTKTKLSYLLLALCIAALVVAGCSRQSKKERHLRRAEAHFKASDYDRAEIEYKNVLRLDQTNRVAIRNLGLMAGEQGRVVQAFVMLTQAREANPEDAEVRLRLGLIQLANGAPTNAHAEALWLLTRQPTNEEALLLLAESCLTSNDVQAARQRLTDLKPVSGETAGYHIAWGLLQLRGRDVTNAEVSFRQALALNPKSSQAHQIMGNLYLVQRDRTNAEIELHTAAELSKPRSPHRLRYAEFKLATGDVAEARRLLEQMSKATPDYLPALLKQAEIALAERRLQDADGILKNVLSRDQVNLEAMLLLARLRVAQNSPDKAEEELQRALKVYPKLPQVHFQLALVRLSQQNLSGAARSFNDALAIRPDYVEAVLALAELNIRRNEPAPAIAALTTLVQQRPDLTQAQLLLATAYRARASLKKSPEDLNQALQVYQRLGQRFPTNPEPALLAGTVLLQQGKRAEARKSYEQALTFAPDYLVAVQQLVALDLAERDFAGAKTHVQKQIERAPKAAAPYVLLAEVYRAETNLPAAETALQKAIECDADFRPAQVMLAQVYVAANKHEQALQKLEELAARNTNDIVSLLQIAELQSAASNYPAAKGAYEKILAVNSRYGPALNNLAWLLSEHMGDPKRGYELAARAHDQLPNDPSTSDTFGWILYRNREYARALPLIQESAAKLTSQPEVQYHLGMTHYMMGEEAAARVALQSAVQLARQGDWRAEAEKRLLILEIDPGTADAKTVTELKALLHQSPDDPVVLTLLAEVAERDGNWNDAIAGYEKALAANPRLVPEMVKLARLYAGHTKDPNRAIALARRAKEIEPDDPVIAHTLGKLAYDSARSGDDYRWAFSLLQESARSLPGDPEVQFDFALATYAVGQPDNAAALMKAVMAANPPPARVKEARTFVEIVSLAGDPAKAEASSSRVQAALQQRPDYVPALIVTGTLQERKGDLAGARETYERVLKLMPLFVPANRSLARIYFGLKDSAKAYDHANKAREAFPRDLEVARLLGMLTFDRGEYPRAVQLLQECAPAFPSDADVFYKLGMAQHKMKQGNESKGSLNKALALAPNSQFAPEAKRLLTELK